MNDNPISDTDLQAVHLLKQGDLAGLDLLVQRYQVRAVHAALLILQDRSLAEEAAQTAFLTACQKIHQFDENRPFAPWFFRIVVNTALKETRHTRRQVSLSDGTLSDGTAAEENTESQQAAAWLIDPALCPEDLVVQEETRRMVRQALDCLTPRQRAVVVMRYYLEMSEREMTDHLNQPLSTVKWWLYDARQKLLKLIVPNRSDRRSGENL